MSQCLSPKIHSQVLSMKHLNLDVSYSSRSIRFEVGSSSISETQPSSTKRSQKSNDIRINKKYKNYRNIEKII